jgi:ribonuclease P protein component
VKYRFPKTVRLRKRYQYQRMTKPDTRYVGRWIILDVKANSFSFTRLGITVSRRYGKAVQRNRFKRIVRETFRMNQAQLHPGLDINIKPRSAALKATPENIQTDLLHFLLQHNSQNNY